MTLYTQAQQQQQTHVRSDITAWQANRVDGTSQRLPLCHNAMSFRSRFSCRHMTVAHVSLARGDSGRGEGTPAPNA